MIYIIHPKSTHLIWRSDPTASTLWHRSEVSQHATHHPKTNKATSIQLGSDMLRLPQPHFRRKTFGRSVCQWFKDGLAEIGSNHSDYRTGLGLTVVFQVGDTMRHELLTLLFSLVKKGSTSGAILKRMRDSNFSLYIYIYLQYHKCNTCNTRYVVNTWQKSRDQNTSWAIWLLTNCLLFSWIFIHFVELATQVPP